MSSAGPSSRPKTLADLVSEARARIREWDADELHTQLTSGADVLLIDVREPDEYARGHLPGSLLLPRGLLEAAADPSNRHRVAAVHSARERTVVLICDTGARSALAADTLQQMGFRQVYNLAGGIQLWEAEDYPVERSAYSP